MKRRKILVPIDIEKPNKKIKGYLYPNLNNKKENSFIEINSGKVWKTGMIVLRGGGIDENDIFKEIIDSGQEIASVDNLLNCLKDYLNQVNDYKIGNIMGIELFQDGFKLIKLEKPNIKNSNLP